MGATVPEQDTTCSGADLLRRDLRQRHGGICPSKGSESSWRTPWVKLEIINLSVGLAFS